ncbi:MAG: TonB-dependent receptor [Pseudomonadota bacterium]
MPTNKTKRALSIGENLEAVGAAPTTGGTNAAFTGGAMRARLRQHSSVVVLTTAIAMLGASSALAQGEEGGDVIIVTAQKREQNLQDVPVSINVLGAEELEQRNIQGFADYAIALPSVSFSSVGPGQSEVFFRGLSDGGNGNPSGTAPSAAIYLDEQPVTTIGSNLDIHIYDIARVEALAGPQSTLFGASSQTGTLRIVTNGPDASEFTFGADVSGHTVFEGDEGYSLEGFVNIPIIEDRAALRVVAWNVENAGYIDNVQATRTFTRNGQTVSNDEFVEDDFNTETKTGLRAALGIDLDDNWTATLRTIYQKQETDGVFDHDPEDVGDLQVERFFNDSYRDEFVQFSGTIEGKVGGLDLVYSGSYLDRDTQYVNDYSEYAEYSAYIDYYTCDYAYSYVTYTTTFSNCNDPRIQFQNDEELKRQTHEFRVLSDASKRLRFLAGFFYDRQEQDYIFQYRIPEIKPGFAISFSPGTAPDNYFVTDQVRVDEQIAGFGEVSFDITPALTGTFGYRYADTQVSLTGDVGTVFSATAVDVETKDTRSLFKGNLTYRLNDDVLTYTTFSQGFRPGGVNREATTNIPLTFRPDTVDNYEIGWKTTFFDKRLRFNGAAFYMEWSDIQFSRFDPGESLLALTNNAGDARAIGVEVDFAADVTDRLTLSGGFVVLDAELTEDFIQDVTAAPGATPDAPEGTRLPFAPRFKGSLNARYERPIGAYNVFGQADVSYTGATFNDLFLTTRDEQDSFAILNMSAGLSRDQWTMSLWLQNVTDTRAELLRNATDFDTRITTNRPRTLGVSLGFRY